MLPLLPLLQEQAEKIRRDWDALPGTPAPLTEAALTAMTLSDFVRDALLSHPEWCDEMMKISPQPNECQHYQSWLQQEITDIRDEAAFMQVLRIFRKRMMSRIAWMQGLELCPTQDTLRQLSHLAEILIVTARDWLYQRCCLEWGTPVNAEGREQPLLILGMGKLGGGELNFSSDIDLIFIYPENGETQGGRRSLDNAQFFTRLGQHLIKVLDQPTVDGFVYRVDMRLRPFGESGPLVLSFAAMEDYYQEQGRDWERYAMIKARLMGDEQSNYEQELRRTLMPFVFRRYIDFSVIQSLRNMKGMIEREVRRRRLKDNIKLGAGGIREAEFIAQVFQLIRGGREPELRGRSLLPTLEAIAHLGLLPQEQVTVLKENYLFLRRLENTLQAIADEQTQTLPDSPLDRERLSWMMGQANWDLLYQVIEQRMAQVRAIFREQIGEDDAEQDENVDETSFNGLWLDSLEASDLAPLLPQLNDEQHQMLLKIAADFRHDVDKRTIGPRGRDVLDHLMPRVFAEVCPREDAIEVLPRLTYLLLGIVTRTTYLELLVENHAALKQLIRLCAASPMVASKLARYPLLLDELLDPNTLYQPTPLNAYRDELRQYLLRVPEGDEEQQLEALRQFKQVQQLRIAAADIADVLPIMKVSDHLTYLAEAMIDGVVQLAWSQMTARYGQPSHLQGREGRGFAVLGYGKLGGWELGYSSDLDLVFLVDCPNDSMTDGERCIDGKQFYLRLAQRIIHLFSTRTSSGILYEVDARLRPSGDSGLLVSTVEAFSDYQHNEAWTWEHQALVRARMVYGDAVLHQQFETIRREILCKPRDGTSLQKEVREMREKMRTHLGSKDKLIFDLKADEGGITDIEFIAQYLVLRFACTEPRLTRWSDNVRILELMANYNIMQEQEAQSLTAAYVTMRDEVHRLALLEKSGKVSTSLFTVERGQVEESWRRWLLDEQLAN